MMSLKYSGWKGEYMSKLECPKCKEGLGEIIRVIEVRCRFDEEADDYLNEAGGERFIDLCPACRTELEIF
jgi:hypothetical protein